MKQIVIVSLVLLSMGMLVVSCAGGEKFPEPEEGVYLSPTSIEVQPGQELSINIEVKPSGWGVSGGEVNLSFNPSVLEVIDIKLGNFLGSSPIVGLQQVDDHEGVVRLALARVGETTVPSPSGILATVEFNVLDSATSGSYEIELTSVGLADQDFQDITGFPIQGTSLKISP